ncbi:MAG: hypothetical protein IPM04_14355 [Saprospiraceae bacterium]|nr:hypothetical protein [Candidatus Brachybacter algidus]MBK8748966.1 hypothetical protein [Candidatus Brachybacter algidus]
MKSLTLTKVLLLFTLSFTTTTILAQVKIGGNQKENPHPSAVLELQSTDRGLLMPRLHNCKCWL